MKSKCYENAHLIKTELQSIETNRNVIIVVLYNPDIDHKVPSRYLLPECKTSQKYVVTNEGDLIYPYLLKLLNFNSIRVNKFTENVH